MAVLSLETDPLRDAVEALIAAQRALATRHGARFRALERQIEAFADNIEKPEVQYIGAGIFVAAPGPELRALLTSIRDLGL